MALLDLRKGFLLTFKHHLCGIKTCLTKHAAYACMFYHVRHNNITSYHHLGSQQHDKCIMLQSYVSRYLNHLDYYKYICWDSLTEWSKVPDLGSSLKGYVFKSHSYIYFHFFVKPQVTSTFLTFYELPTSWFQNVYAMERI